MVTSKELYIFFSYFLTFSFSHNASFLLRNVDDEQVLLVGFGGSCFWRRFLYTCLFLAAFWWWVSPVPSGWETTAHMDHIRRLLCWQDTGLKAALTLSALDKWFPDVRSKWTKDSLAILTLPSSLAFHVEFQSLLLLNKSVVLCCSSREKTMQMSLCHSDTPSPAADKKAMQLWW